MRSNRRLSSDPIMCRSVSLYSSDRRQQAILIVRSSFSPLSSLHYRQARRHGIPRWRYPGELVGEPWHLGGRANHSIHNIFMLANCISRAEMEADQVVYPTPNRQQPFLYKPLL